MQPQQAERREASRGHTKNTPFSVEEEQVGGLPSRHSISAVLPGAIDALFECVRLLVCCLCKRFLLKRLFVFDMEKHKLQIFIYHSSLCCSSRTVEASCRNFGVDRMLNAIFRTTRRLLGNEFMFLINSKG